MVNLSLMSQEEFEEYLETAIQHLADEISKARDLSPTEGMKAAEDSFKSLFPERRVDSKDQYVYNIICDEDKIGIIHFGVKRDKRKPYIYLWDIAIHPDSRGKGYGAQAMLALEAEVAKIGLKRIRLNVFGHNAPAIKMYERLGYHPESMALLKEVGQ